ncbi:MAG: HPr kinase/phosphatase C-terminal domain-containing protein [Hyphomicrobiales bacterium]
MSEIHQMIPAIHGTCVVYQKSGILITGRSGSGKSQLALALMSDAARPSTLVADDGVLLRAEGTDLWASVPRRLRGKIERYGMGIEIHGFVETCRLVLVVELTPPDQIERMPEPDTLIWTHQKISLPKLILPEQPSNGASSIYATLKRINAWL